METEIDAKQATESATEGQEAPREGVRCPACGSGDWNLGKTRAKMPRAVCQGPGCGKSWAPWPDWKRGPGFGCTAPEKVETIRRLLESGHEDAGVLSAAAGVSRWVAMKYRRRWRLERARTVGVPGAYGVA